MRSLGSLVLCLIVGLSTVAPSKAAVIVDVFEGTNSLTFKYSGSIDTLTVSAVGPTLVGGASFSSQQSYFQNDARMIYNTGSTSPSVVLGNGGAVAATSVKPGSTAFHFDFVSKTLGLPVGYVSGSAIDGEVVIFGNLAYHGMAPGSHTYSWFNLSGTDSVTLNVGTISNPVPEPASLSIFAIGSLVAGYRFHRRKNKAVS